MPNKFETPAKGKAPRGKGTPARQAHPRASASSDPTVTDRKPRTGRGKVARKEGAPAVVVGATAEEAAATLAAAQVAAEQLEAVRGKRDELVDAIADAERRLADLRRQADEARDLTELEGALAAVEQRIETSRRRAEETGQQLTGSLQGVNDWVEATRADLETARREVAEAQAAVHAVRESADAAKAEAARTLEHLRAAAPQQTEQRAGARRHHAAGNGSIEPQELQRIVPLRRDEVADDARVRLIEYLNDAGAVEREQAGMLQSVIDATGDADLRVALEAHRSDGEARRDAVAARVQALGGEPGGGRRLLGSIVTRLWDALQKPRDAATDPVEGLLKAISAAEFEAGMYLAIQSVALALGDGDTADLAFTHYAQERTFADRLRSRVAPTAVRAVRRAPAERV